MRVPDRRTNYQHKLISGIGIIDLEKRLKQIAKNNETHAKLMAIPGLGLMVLSHL
ncbi:MAG: hypothetical protein QMO91_03475 [Candidatus Tisiphia sp.]|nr:hypothetical protein [Candidatus Tisiphia sp.]